MKSDGGGVPPEVPPGDKAPRRTGRLIWGLAQGTMSFLLDDLGSTRGWVWVVSRRHGIRVSNFSIGSMDYKLSTTVIAQNLSGTVHRLSLSVSQCTHPVRSRLDHSPTIITRHYMARFAGHIFNSKRSTNSLYRNSLTQNLETER